MGTPNDKKCPTKVLELKQKRAREEVKLHSLIERVERKLVQAGGEEVARREGREEAAEIYRDLTVYVNVEPCIMCAAALLKVDLES